MTFALQMSGHSRDIQTKPNKSQCHKQNSKQFYFSWAKRNELAKSRWFLLRSWGLCISTSFWWCYCDTRDVLISGLQVNDMLSVCLFIGWTITQFFLLCLSVKFCSFRCKCHSSHTHTQCFRFASIPVCCYNVSLSHSVFTSVMPEPNNSPLSL